MADEGVVTGAAWRPPLFSSVVQKSGRHGGMAEGVEFEPTEACTSAVFNSQPRRPSALGNVRSKRDLPAKALQGAGVVDVDAALTVAPPHQLSTGYSAPMACGSSFTSGAIADSVIRFAIASASE